MKMLHRGRCSNKYTDLNALNLEGYNITDWWEINHINQKYGGRGMESNLTLLLKTD